jgi:hypothetical protein
MKILLIGVLTLYGFQSAVAKEGCMDLNGEWELINCDNSHDYFNQWEERLFDTNDMQTNISIEQNKCDSILINAKKQWVFKNDERAYGINTNLNSHGLTIEKTDKYVENIGAIWGVTSKKNKIQISKNTNEELKIQWKFRQFNFGGPIIPIFTSLNKEKTTCTFQRRN